MATKKLNITNKEKARKKLIKQLRRNHEGWSLRTSERLQSHWLGMHLHHYENTQLSHGLSDCTSWGQSQLSQTNINVENINFPDWLQNVQERHLLADLAKGVVEGVIRMIFSTVKDKQSVSEPNKNTMEGVDTIADELAENIQLIYDCRIADHHIVTAACEDHQQLTKRVQRLAAKPVCCNCAFSQLVQPATSMLSPRRLPHVPRISLTVNSADKPVSPDRPTSFQTASSAHYVDYSTSSQYPVSRTSVTGDLTTNMSRFSAFTSTTARQQSKPRNMMSRYTPSPLTGDSEDEWTSYISGTEPASHNVTVAPDSDDISFPTDPTQPASKLSNFSNKRQASIRK